MILCYYVNLLRLFKPNHRYRIIYSLRLENGVTMTPKRRLLTLIFACFVRFRVIIEMLKPDKPDSAITLKGLDYIDVPGLSKREYRLHFFAHKEGTFSAKVSHRYIYIYIYIVY